MARLGSEISLETDVVPDRLGVARRIRERREYLGISRAEAAAEIGLSVQAYGHKETGRSGISGIELALLAELLQTRVAYFYAEEGDGETRRRDLDRLFDELPPDMQQVVIDHVRSIHAAFARRGAAGRHGSEEDGTT